MKPLYLLHPLRWAVVLALLGLAACTSSPPAPTPAAARPGYLVGAYYYPWYFTSHWADHDYVGRHLPEPLEPRLGEYLSDDHKVIAAHLQWAAQYGIDFLIISWSLRDSFADQTARKHLLPALAESTVKQAPYIEFVAYGQRDLGSIQFRQHIADDLRFVGEQYLKHPSALRIGGRPVLFFYASRILTGDVAGWMREVRELFAGMGLAPLIVADEAFWHEPDVARLRSFDGITAYNVYDWPRGANAGWAGSSTFLTDVEGLFTRWQAAAGAAGAAFVPNAMPGFNDRGVRLEENHFVIPRRLHPDGPITGLFERSIELAKRFTDPTLRMVTITSFNEWNEWTAIEPTRIATGKAPLPGAAAYTQGFPHDDFGFAYLEQIKAHLGSTTTVLAKGAK